MRHYDLDRPAQLDVLDLFDYALDYGEAYERQFADGLIACFERIAEYPHSGRNRPELLAELRSVVSRKLKVVVFYFPPRLEDQRVRIARVIRQERDIHEEDFA